MQPPMRAQGSIRAQTARVPGAAASKAQIESGEKVFRGLPTRRGAWRGALARRGSVLRTLWRGAADGP